MLRIGRRVGRRLRRGREGCDEGGKTLCAMSGVCFVGAVSSRGAGCLTVGVLVSEMVEMEM